MLSSTFIQTFQQLRLFLFIVLHKYIGFFWKRNSLSNVLGTIYRLPFAKHVLSYKEEGLPSKTSSLF